LILKYLLASAMTLSPLITLTRPAPFPYSYSTFNEDVKAVIFINE